MKNKIENVTKVAQVVKNEGGDAVSAINTLVGTAFNIITKKPKLYNVNGGLSGPAIKPVALAKVLEISRKVDIPIIGIGGIMNWKDVIENTQKHISNNPTKFKYDLAYRL